MLEDSMNHFFSARLAHHDRSSDSHFQCITSGQQVVGINFALCTPQPSHLALEQVYSRGRLSMQSRMKDMPVPITFAWYLLWIALIDVLLAGFPAS